MFNEGYYCIHTRHIPEFVEPYFAVKCTDYKPKPKEEKEK